MIDQNPLLIRVSCGEKEFLLLMPKLLLWFQSRQSAAESAEWAEPAGRISCCCLRGFTKNGAKVLRQPLSRAGPVVIIGEEQQ